MDERTVDTIIEDLKRLVKDRINVSPHHWLEAALMLAVLVEDIEDEMIDVKFSLAEKRAGLMRQGMTGIKAKTLIDADPEQKQYELLSAKVKRVNEIIRVAKKRATVAEEGIMRQ